MHYKLMFISFFSPQNTNRFKFSVIASKVQKKIYLKQSYLLFSWFFYLTSFNLTQNKIFNLSIAYLPIKRKIFTATKAPMAHKTNSKEQFSYAYHKFLINFKINLGGNCIPNSADNGLGFALILKKKFIHFETNLFISKFTKFLFHINCTKFINYYLHVSRLI